MLVASSTTIGAGTGDRELFAAAENRLMHIKLDRMNLGKDDIASPNYHSRCPTIASKCERPNKARWSIPGRVSVSIASVRSSSQRGMPLPQGFLLPRETCRLDN